MDMPISGLTSPPVSAPTGDSAAKEGGAATRELVKKPEPKKNQVGAAQDAAKAILAKFGKRGK